MSATSHSNRVAAAARIMLATTLADMANDIGPHPTPSLFDEPRKIGERKVNYKLKAKNRARRKEANRQKKMQRHAA